MANERTFPVTHGRIADAARVLTAEAQRRLDGSGRITESGWSDAISATSRRLGQRDDELSDADEDALGEALVRRGRAQEQLLHHPERVPVRVLLDDLAVRKAGEGESRDLTHDGGAA